MSFHPEFVYVMFSATDCSIGRFIRKMTRSKYNHVSVSFDPDMQSLYSFARYHKTAPFYAGFVEESLMRYQLTGRQATVKVCRIRLSDQQAATLRYAVDEVQTSQVEYIYNYLSALTFLARKRFDVPHAFTCVDFAVWLLSRAGIAEVPDTFFTIEDLEAALSAYVIFEGESQFYADALTWGNDAYADHLTRRSSVIGTATILGKLFYRTVARFM